MRGRIKIADSPIPDWVKEWDENVQPAPRETSATLEPVEHRVEHTGTKRTLKAIMPIIKNTKYFFLVRSISYYFNLKYIQNSVR